MQKRWRGWRGWGLLAGLTACGGDDGGGTGTGTTGVVATATETGATGTSTGDGTTVAPPTGTPPTTGGSTTEGVVDTGTTASTETGSTTEDTGPLPCGGCPPNFKCKYDTCIPDLGECTTYDDCPGDSYCDADGECIPYGVPPEVFNDPMCQKDNIPAGINPDVQCEWTGVLDPVTDKTKNSTLIYTTPMVADLNLDLDPFKLQPSIIVTTFEQIGNMGRIGTLRVFDGRTCAEQMRAGGADAPDDSDRPAYAVPWAIGDLDNDVPSGGHPELVGYHRVTSPNDAGPVQLYAFKIDVVADTPLLSRMWYGRDCETNQVLNFSSANLLNGPLLQDLNDDEYPEIIVGEMVFDREGCLQTTWNASYTNMMPVVADVDEDGGMDLMSYRRTASWDPATTEWVDKPWYVANPQQQTGGYWGAANMGSYSQVEGLDPANTPELVVLSVVNGNGRLRIQTVDGEVVWGPVTLYAKPNQVIGQGGPVTISDFDGDGFPEMATAAATYYAVYDPDCVAALGGESPPERPGGKCVRSPEQEALGLPDGVLWVQPSQDLSSNITGSSIFDFNGDGRAEAVYRDECFLRVYDGGSGQVIFSAPASSGTGLEYPTIADVDGDFATEIVVPRTPYNACPQVDPLYPKADNFQAKTGFVIYRDPGDLWANSRPVWNQHPYYITHVTDDARIPRASETESNWLVPGLNNFRQNSQGSFGKLNIADLTVELTDLGKLCDLQGGMKTLQAEVCNRGTNPVQDGVAVHFLETTDPAQPVADAMVVCAAVTTKLLQPGECEIVACDAVLQGGGNIYVDVDPEDAIADCHPGNNLGADAFELCPG